MNSGTASSDDFEMMLSLHVDRPRGKAMQALHHARREGGVMVRNIKTKVCVCFFLRLRCRNQGLCLLFCTRLRSKKWSARREGGVMVRNIKTKVCICFFAQD